MRKISSSSSTPIEKEYSIPLTPMLSQYMELKKAYPDCLLFFRLGDFYELFFEDAKIASKAIDLTLTRRGKIGEEEIPMCGVPFHAYENYLARLIRQGFKVAICEQMETPEEAKRAAKLQGGKALVKRDVVRLVTPGTLTEDTLLTPSAPNYLASFVFDKDIGCLSFVDISTGDFFLESFPLTALPHHLSRINPSEILTSDSILEKETLKEIFAPYQKILSLLPRARFDKNNALKKLKSLYEVDTLEGFGSFTELELTAGGTLLDYIELTQKGKIPHLSIPKKVKNTDYLELDTTTRRSLEITQTQKGEYLGSFLWAINRTVTAFGSRLLLNWVSFPLKKVARIEDRLDCITFFLQHVDVPSSLRTELRSTPDIQRLLGRLSVGRGGPRDLGNLLTGLEKIAHIKTILNKIKEKKPSLLEYLHTNLIDLKNLHTHLKKALLQDAPLPLLAREGGFIAPGYNAELDRFLHLKNNSHEAILALQARYIQETGITSLKIRHNNIIGYFIDINPSYASKLDPTFIHRQTLASSMRFTTADLIELEQNLLSASEKALQLELSLYETLLQQVLEHKEDLSKIAKSLAALDVLSSLSILAQENNLVRPTLDESKVFDVQKGRHIGVDLSLQKDTGKSFIPNDCSLSQKYICLLTGPNMAGKSTFLRQNALLVILAQMGSYVPAEKMHLGIVDKVFSRVGASDDLARGQSTFMVEMTETAAILNQATDRSFLILDEIGRGTATFDGLSIAWGCLEYIHNHIKARTLFATHYHELTHLQETVPSLSIFKMAVREWENKIVFLYQVQEGASDRSYGIHVAQLAGLPAEVTTRAEEILQQLEQKDATWTPAHLAEPLSKKKPAAAALSPLPLFAPTVSIPRELEELQRKLQQIDPDALSPKEALEKLYELKIIIQKSS